MGEKLQFTSAEFEKAFTTGSSPAIDCEFCSRTHYALQSRDFEEGELEELLIKTQKDLGKYIGWNYTGIDWGHINGKQYVAGCPCNEGKQFEEFLLRHKYQIAEFFKLWADQQSEIAESAKRVASDTANVTDFKMKGDDAE